MTRTISDNVREMTKSLTSLSGSLAAFGLQQTAPFLGAKSSGAAPRNLARELEQLTSAAVGRLGGREHAAFVLSEAFGRNLIEVMADFATLNPGGALGLLLGPLAESLDPIFRGGDGRVGVRTRELLNKLEIYLLVQNVESRLRISPTDRAPLVELVDRAYGLGPFLSLWALEGLGHAVGERALRENGRLRGLLCGREAEEVRSGALPMLHAGIGLAFAQMLLDKIHTPEGLAQAVDRFVLLCRENSQPGYLGAAYESLGLVARTFHPAMVEAIDRWLCHGEAEMVGYFWHGVGRAIYFAKANFLPSHQIDWANAPAVAPTLDGRLNVTAGLSWAVTLVNMRHPAVMKGLLAAHGPELAGNPGFVNGVASSIEMRHDTTPTAPFLVDFLNYQPSESPAGIGEVWRRLVREPAVEGLREDYVSLSRNSRLGELFHYRSPTGTVAAGAWKS